MMPSEQGRGRGEQTMTDTLTFDSVRAAHREMENQILQAVREAVEGFGCATGLSPHSICIHILKEERLGDSYPKYVVVDVTANVRL